MCFGYASLAASVALSAENGLFASTEPLVIRIEAPFSTIVNSRKKPEYQDAVLKFQDANGERSVGLRLRVRGHSRVEACDFPPLLLNFKTNELVGTLFEGEDKLKLTTHCMAISSHDQLIRLEYLSYRVLNLLTETSLRARPVTVTYYDTQRMRVVAAERMGFFVEDDERFAERKGLQPVDVVSIDRGRYDRDSLALVDMFEYFIGNTDWSALLGPKGSHCCHNVLPFQRGDGVLVPVPYDFDSSGIVNAPYALPDQRLRIAAVRQRLYRGPRCQPTADLEAQFAKFDAARPQLLELFSVSSGLDKSTAAGATSYVQEFFAVRADPKKVERAFFTGCKK
ncbi:MAG TPA: hypothetical protein VL131_11825 [Gammaproteobacteria bacterium]|nr:hypothetical protein [Gammaproteobacteria bacterium]